MASKTLKDSIFDEARFRVLNVLYYADEPVGLREIAYRSELSLGAVQASVRSLLGSGHIRRSETGYESADHPEWAVLRMVYHALQIEHVKSQATNDPKAAIAALDDLYSMSRRIRKAANGS